MGLPLWITMPQIISALRAERSASAEVLALRSVWQRMARLFSEVGYRQLRNPKHPSGSWRIDGRHITVFVPIFISQYDYAKVIRELEHSERTRMQRL